ncbi:MAG TPA: peptidyl-prolyl cis-trans isomerase, partial [Bryobacteraceae bacterium]|nr:peptidyl-prolyl cis-trans isomerase [Bryobacteraceae bacterium]
MFDLFRSRAKAVRYLLGALLMLVAISMVVTLIPGFGTIGTRQEQIVAEIGERVLTARDVQQRINMAQRAQSVPREMLPALVPQFIDSMILEQVMAYEAQRLGLNVTPDELARGLQVLVPQLFQGGQFVGKEAYASLLAQQNMTIPEFEANVRSEMMVSKLQDLVAQSVVVTPAEIEAEYKSRNEKVKLSYVEINPERYRSEVFVSPAEIRQYYETRKAQYRIPEKRSIDLVVVSEEKIAKTITIPEPELRQAYEANKDQYRTPERVRVRHILLKTTDVPKDQVPQIKAKAEELLKQLKAGADFAALATKNSEDPGSATRGGDLGWIVRGQTVPNFESTAFSLKPNELSDVITTEYGFHIIQVLEKENARLRPFEEVKEQLAQERKKQRVFETMQRLADESRDRLLKSPGAAQQIAQELGVTYVHVEKAGAGDQIPEVGVNPDFEDTIRALAKGGVTPVFEAPGNKLAVATVTEIFPARDAELSEVENQIRAELVSQKLVVLVTQKAQEAANKAKEFNGDLRKLAQALGLQVKTTQEFTRTGAADGIGSAAAVYQAFEQPVGSIFGPVTVEDKRFICKVESKTPADMSKLAESRE